MLRLDPPFPPISIFPVPPSPVLPTVTIFVIVGVPREGFVIVVRLSVIVIALGLACVDPIVPPLPINNPPEKLRFLMLVVVSVIVIASGFAVEDPSTRHPDTETLGLMVANPVGIATPLTSPPVIRRPLLGFPTNRVPDRSPLFCIIVPEVSLITMVFGFAVEDPMDKRPAEATVGRIVEPLLLPVSCRAPMPGLPIEIVPDESPLF